MYRGGEGVFQDDKEAVAWYRKAAEQGDIIAQWLIGYMYANGRGVVQDYKVAITWFRKAAEQGNAGAQLSLGWAYDKGEGVVQDNVYAYMWYNIAASNGYKGSSEQRDETAKKMTAADISKAQELARECVKKQYKGC